MKQVIIYTDGSCLGNPGPGGYAAILRCNGREKEISCGYFKTTNNRMELLAVIVALEQIKAECQIALYSDSQYMKNGIQSWIQNWRKNGWQTSAKKPVKNKDLWIRLDEVSRPLTIEWHWVKGHSGDEYNERCDQLARAAAEHPTDIDHHFIQGDAS